MQRKIHLMPMTLTYKDFLEKLKSARKETGLTQIEAGNALGRTQAGISKIEQGEVALSVEDLFDFAELYKKPVAYFFQKETE